MGRNKALYVTINRFTLLHHTIRKTQRLYPNATKRPIRGLRLITNGTRPAIPPPQTTPSRRNGDRETNLRKRYSRFQPCDRLVVVAAATHVFLLLTPPFPVTLDKHTPRQQLIVVSCRYTNIFLQFVKTIVYSFLHFFIYLNHTMFKKIYFSSGEITKILIIIKTHGSVTIVPVLLPLHHFLFLTYRFCLKMQIQDFFPLEKKNHYHL